jgi:competence protein ComEC
LWGAWAASVALIWLLRRYLLARLALGMLAGFAWAAWIAYRMLAPHLDLALEGQEIHLVGTIDSLPYRFAQGVRFQFAVEAVRGTALQVPPKVVLGWYGQPGDQRQVLPAVQPGERWQLTVRLQRPHGNANPHGFDAELWMLEQGVRASGYVRPDWANNRRLDQFVPSVGALVERCRAVLRERIEVALPGMPYTGVIVALVIGDQRGIDQAEWTIFSRTGISHLVSI